MGGASVVVYTKVKPENTLLESYVQEHREFQLEGSFGGTPPRKRVWSPGARLRRVSGAESEKFVEINDVKKVFEDDDMPDEVAELVPSPCWQLGISHAYSDNQAWGDCLNLAAYLADRCQGVAYTGESGIEWPESALHRSPRVVRQEEKIDVLTFEWFVFYPKMSAASVTGFLGALEEIFPAAWPRRFGDDEPLQKQLPRYEQRPFVDFWQELHDDDGFFKILSLKADSPCIDGRLTFPVKSGRLEGEDFATWKARGLTQTENIGTIELRFDGRVVSSDSAQLEKALQLFKAVAVRVKSFYARGYLDREVGCRSGIGQMGAYPYRTGPEWTGLPPMPMWLSWFGRPYMELVSNSVASFNPEVTGEGAFVQLGSKPRALRELEACGFSLPRELLPTKARLNTITEQVLLALKKLEAETSEWSPPPGAWSPPVWERGRAEVIPDFDC